MNRAFSGFAVFDLDGTLADSLADISRALGRVLQRNGRKGIPEAETRELIGKGPRTLIERAWKLTGESAGEEEVAILTRQYLEEYRKNPKGGTRSFPGVDDGLRRLVQKGWRLGLCTNKADDLEEDLQKNLKETNGMLDDCFWQFLGPLEPGDRVVSAYDNKMTEGTVISIQKESAHKDYGSAVVEFPGEEPRTMDVCELVKVRGPVLPTDSVIPGPN